MIRTYEEINEKIQSGDIAVFTAEEAIAMCKEQGHKKAYENIDVVTCATFGMMCSSGAFFNFGHTDKRIRMSEITMNNVPASGGLAAVDTYLGATQGSLDRPMTYGGAHVIEELLKGEKINLHAKSYGTDAYPRKEAAAEIGLEDMNQAYMYNPRNCYQNYSAATNCGEKTIHTYMGTLFPDCGNVNYSTSGELSPLLKDPYMRTIGMGTKIFLGGAQGYVTWQGTQSEQNVTEYEDGVNFSGGTLAVIGDLKKMSPRYIRAAVMKNYGISMYVGIGIPIPVLDIDLFEDLTRTNDELYTNFIDYSTGALKMPQLGRVSYAQLRSGRVELNGKQVPTAPMSSLFMAREIAQNLKENIKEGSFTLNKPIKEVDMFSEFKPLKLKEEEQ
ncbi:MAG: homocysteine biosynthesis protein [Eubacteriales bacterium]